MESGGNIKIDGLCLDTAGQATASGTAAVLNICGPSATQIWAPATGRELVNKVSGLCLSISSAESGSGGNLANCTTTAADQRWWLPAM